nr:xylulose kinase-1 [Tanacetum cinerariifolium]
MEISTTCAEMFMSSKRPKVVYEEPNGEHLKDNDISHKGGSRWINHAEDSSSTSRWVFLLGEVPFHGLPRSKHGIRVYGVDCCCVHTMAKAYSQVYNEKSKHLGVRHGDDENATNPPLISPTQQAPHTLLTIKLSILKKERERKARTTLLMAIPEDHLAKFHKITDAKEIWEAIKTRFGGNDKSKKMQKYILKQQFDAEIYAKQDEPKVMVTIDGDGVDWTDHAEDDTENYALMAFNSSNSGSDTKVTSCSKECEKTYAKLKKLYDEQREQLGDASIEIQAYTLALKKVEAQLVCHQKNQLAYEEKIGFTKIDLDDKTNVLIYYKKLLAEAEKEKEELKTKLENFQSSSKGLSKLLNSQISAKDKYGLGYGNQIHERVLSYENEVLESVYDSRSSDIEDSPVNDRFAKFEGMHAVSPPMTVIYMPLKFDFGIDESKFTYGPKQYKNSESDAKTSDLASSIGVLVCAGVSGRGLVGVVGEQEKWQEEWGVVLQVVAGKRGESTVNSKRGEDRAGFGDFT